MMMVIITAVISIGWYLTDKGEHTACCKINKNVHSGSSSGSDWILMSCQPHTVTSGQTFTQNLSPKIIYKYDIVYIAHHTHTHSVAQRERERERETETETE